MDSEQSRQDSVGDPEEDHPKASPAETEAKEKGTDVDPPWDRLLLRVWR